jgi:hypothetical protein
MREMIVIRARDDGQWEIQVWLHQSKDEVIERRKICKI